MRVRATISAVPSQLKRNTHTAAILDVRGSEKKKIHSNIRDELSPGSRVVGTSSSCGYLQSMKSRLNVGGLPVEIA